jgi:hypothetical protein
MRVRMQRELEKTLWESRTRVSGHDVAVRERPAWGICLSPWNILKWSHPHIISLKHEDPGCFDEGGIRCGSSEELLHRVGPVRHWKLAPGITLWCQGHCMEGWYLLHAQRPSVSNVRTFYTAPEHCA